MKVVLTNKEKMTKREMVVAIDFFMETASEMAKKLHQTFEECDDNYESCSGVEVPTCLFDEAGIDLDIGLQFYVGDGEIIISEIDG